VVWAAALLYMLLLINYDLRSVQSSI